MKLDKNTNFKHLPKKNIEETQRILGNLNRHLKEIGQKAEDIQLKQVHKKIQNFYDK